MKLNINKNEWLLLKEALEDYYYICKEDESLRYKLEEILKLQENLNDKLEDDL